MASIAYRNNLHNCKDENDVGFGGLFGSILNFVKLSY